MTDPLARATQVQIAYKTPLGNAPDQYALRVLSSVLQQGDSSRLYQTLNKEKELVVGIGGFVDERIGPGGLYIGATVRPGKKAEDVEAAIYSEIERLQQQPIAEWELEKAKNTTRFGYLQSIRSAQSRATQLGTYTVKFNDPGLINTRARGLRGRDARRTCSAWRSNTCRRSTAPSSLPIPRRRRGRARRVRHSSHETSDPRVRRRAAGMDRALRRATGGHAESAGARFVARVCSSRARRPSIRRRCASCCRGAQEATLSNGLRVALLEDHKLPTFSLQLLLTGGGLDDPADQHGVAMVTASLLREGTTQRTSRQIAEQLATLGGAFSAGRLAVVGRDIDLDRRPERERRTRSSRSLPTSCAIPRSRKRSSTSTSRGSCPSCSSSARLPGFVAQEEFMRAVYGDAPRQLRRAARERCCAP